MALLAFLLSLQIALSLGFGGGGGSSSPPPPPCTYDNWGGWSLADTCVLTRLRYCTVPSGCSGGCQGQQDQGYQSITNVGSWGAWSSYGPWSTTCGTGSRTRTRSCIPAPTCNVGCPGGASSSTEQSTSIGATSVWTAWSPWTAACGPATRSRSCQQLCGSTAGCPGSATDSRTLCCPSPSASWTGWSFGPWNSNCGYATRIVTRSCVVPSFACTTTCPGDSQRTDQNCCVGAVDGQWSPWTSWSGTCVTQTSTNTRTRTCSASCGGSSCPGLSQDTRSLGTGATCCLVNAAWSSWAPWTSWSTTCGDGSRSRTRSCNYPAGLDSRCYGSTCPGSSSESATRTAFLAVNGGWTSWSGWDLTCGNRQRTRTCSNPTTSCGGTFCSGLSLSTSFVCCPVPASWSGWSAWSPWSGACGGQQTRTHTRTCSTPCGTAICPGSSSGSSTKPVAENCCVGTYGRNIDNTCQPCSVCAPGLSVTSACTTLQNTVCADITPPVVTLQGPNPQTTEAGQPWIDPGATATDVISGRLPVVVTPAAGVNVRLLGSQTITYSATDFAGNTGSTTRTVVVVDTLPPVLTLISDSVITWEANTTYVDPGCQAVDQLDGTVAVTTLGLPINTNRLRNYTISYRACDGRSLCATRNRTVIITQTAVPVITVLGLSQIIVEVPATFVDPGATAYDTVDGFMNSLITRTFEFFDGSTFVPAPAIDPRRLGTYRITYNVVNARGLRALPQTRIVILQDTTAPNITLFGANPFSLQGATAYVEPGFQAMDAFYGNLTALVRESGNVFDVRAPAGTVFTISYTVTDPSGNTRTVTRTVTIIDTIPPRLYLLGNATFFQQANFSFVDPGATANDTLDGDLTANITVTGAVRVNSPYLSSYTLVYSVMDRAGNRATPINRTVIIINNIRPVITLRGSNMTWEGAISPFVDPGATAWDVIEGDISSRIVRSGIVNVMSPSMTTFVLSYNVRGSANLDALTRFRQVTIVDTVIPVITLLGNQTYYQQGAFPYVDPGATAFDTLDGNITNRIVVSNPVLTSSPAGTRFLVTYNVVDAAGNAAVEVNRTVVIIDTIPPNLTLLGNATVHWQGAVPWVDPGCRAMDLLYGDLTSSIRIEGTINFMAPAGTTFTLVYSVTDPAGNEARSLSRTVIIIDTIPPAIELLGADNMTYESATAWVDPGYTAFDTLDGNITSRVIISGTVDVMAPSGSPFQLLYNVRDRAGNAAPQRQRAVTMIDTIPPTITLLGLQVVHHQGATPWIEPGYTAWDALNGNLTANVTISGAVVDVMAYAGTTFEILYTVADVAGNSFQIVRTVIIIDTIAPIIYLNGAPELSHECTFPYSDAGATANDTLDGNLTVNITLVGAVNVWAPSGTVFYLNYSVSDRAGNRASMVVRTVRVVDTIPPNVTLLGAVQVTAEGGAPYLDFGAVSHDLLDGDLTAQIIHNVTLNLTTAGLTSPLAPSPLPVEGGMDIITTYAPLSSVYTIVYLSVDRAGNVGRTQRQITIVSTLPPVLLLLGEQSVRVREGTTYLDAGAVASSQYFGDLTSAIAVRNLADLPMQDITSKVGSQLLEFTVSDAAGLEATPRYRTVNVLAAVPVLNPSTSSVEAGASTGAGGSSIPISKFSSYSTVSFKFDMGLTTPAQQMDAVAYKICFIPYPRVTNIMQMLANASIFPTYLQCTNDLFRFCVMEAPLITSADIERLRALNRTVSVSLTPLPLVNYVGAFNTTPPVTPSDLDAAVLLKQKGISATTNLDCADTTCAFFTSARPTRQINVQRAVARTEIGAMFLNANPVALMKRALTVSVDPSILNITQDQVLAAINLLGLQPNDLSCDRNTCILQTYDPLQPRQVDMLNKALPQGSTVSDVSFFVNTVLQFANPSPSNSTDAASALFLASAAGLAPYSASCTSTTCTLMTHAVVSTAQIQALSTRVHDLDVYRLNQSLVQPQVLLGYYSTSVTISSSSNVIAALAAANITNYGNLTCLASLLFDNAVQCTFITPTALDNSQVFGLRDFPGVYAVTPSKAVTFEDMFAESLKRELASKAGISPDRIIVTSVDPSTGMVSVDILSSAFGSNSNNTLFTGNFTVSMTSISTNNATNILLAAGIVPVDVQVAGNVVTYKSANVTAEMLARLRGDPRVTAASNVVVAQPVLTHQEAAALILELVDNNQLTVPLGGRNYWAVPKSGSVSDSSNRSSPRTSSVLNTASMSGVIVGGVVLMLVVLLAVILYRRAQGRRRVKQSREQSAIYAATMGRSDPMQPHFGMGIHNPLYEDDSALPQNDQLYDDLHLVASQMNAAGSGLAAHPVLRDEGFFNPMYGSGAAWTQAAAYCAAQDPAYQDTTGLSLTNARVYSEPRSGEAQYAPVKAPYSALYGHSQTAPGQPRPYDCMQRFAVPVEGENAGYMEVTTAAEGVYDLARSSDSDYLQVHGEATYSDPQLQLQTPSTYVAQAGMIYDVPVDDPAASGSDYLQVQGVSPYGVPNTQSTYVAQAGTVYDIPHADTTASSSDYLQLGEASEFMVPGESGDYHLTSPNADTVYSIPSEVAYTEISPPE